MNNYYREYIFLGLTSLGEVKTIYVVSPNRDKAVKLASTILVDFDNRILVRPGRGPSRVVKVV